MENKEEKLNDYQFNEVDIQRSKAYFLGPKSENQDIFEQLFLNSLRDYCHWRKNFHPEDETYVKYKEHLSDGYKEFIQDLKDNLEILNSKLKISVPFFHPRYLGHMNTDITIPALLGYFSAMLYNQNNIVKESSTITSNLETEAVKLLIKMFKMNEETAWGHLSSGGTTANIEALLVAKNIKLFPYQVALALEEENFNNKLLSLNNELVDKYFKKNIYDLRTITIEETINLFIYLQDFCQNDMNMAEIFEKYSLVKLGISDFTYKCRNADKIKENFPDRFVVVMSKNAHYSLKKSLGILGIGESNIISIDLDEKFRMSIEDLENKITNCLNIPKENPESNDIDSKYFKNVSIIAVISVFGSTEEGAIDDLEHTLKIREFCKSRFGDFWIHVDGCYGGYAASMDDIAVNLRDYFYSISKYFSEKSDFEKPFSFDVNQIFENIDYLECNIRALREADSISIDPHKLGYLPYPAGAIVYKNYIVREQIKVDAPYLNSAIDSKMQSTINIDTLDEKEIKKNKDKKIWHNEVLGLYTLEGSRPGAISAAVWLAHKSIPLNRNGHGNIVAQSILGANYLYYALKTKFANPDVFNDPKKSPDILAIAVPGNNLDLNIFCYTFPSVFDNRRVSLSVLNRAIKEIYSSLLPTPQSPTHTKDFVVAKTELEYDKYGENFLNLFCENNKINGRIMKHDNIKFNPWRDAYRLELLRTVVMGPFLLDFYSKDRNSDEIKYLIELFVNNLYEKAINTIQTVLNSPLPSELIPEIPEDKLLLVIDDDPVTQEDLNQILTNGFKIQEQSIKIVSEYRLRNNKICFFGKDGNEREDIDITKITAAIIDIDLGRDKPSGDELINKVIDNKAILPNLKGIVIFSSENILNEHNIKNNYNNRDLEIKVHIKPQRTDRNFQKIANYFLEDIYDFLIK